MSDVFADQSAGITGLELKLDEIDLAFSSKSSREILNEISSSTRGMYISSMLDGNKEIPIRIKNNNIESKINQTSLLAIPGRNGYEYVENFSDIEFKVKLIKLIDIKDQIEFC